MRRSGSRREPEPLVQIPVWGGIEVEAGTGDAPREEGLDALLQGLNPEQRRAVSHGDGPLLVVAGAGTGKTQVITRRIAWLIAAHHARPSEILALTFTDQAADEMQVRVDQLVPYGYTDTAISTFHAFGDRLIREFALELGLPPDVRVLSRPETVVFLREHLFELGLDRYRPLGDPTRFLDALATLFSRAKDEDVSPDAFRAHAGRLRIEASRVREASAAGSPPRDDDGDPAPSADALAEEAQRQAELGEAYARYQELLAANGAIDFGDQVSLALRLLRESPAAREAVQGRFRHVLVDEFQDTNRAQAELVALVAERHRNVTVVGDDDQSIYKFRGAAISNILEFRERYRTAKVVVLRRNYRSRTPILDAAYRLVRHNDPDRLEVRAGISKRLVAERAGEAHPVRHEAFATGAEEADWIASSIAQRVRDGGHPRDVAILVRANAAADPILRSLNLEGVPWRFSGHQRPVQPARDPAPAGVPAGGCGPRVVGRCLRARRHRSSMGWAAMTWSRSSTWPGGATVRFGRCWRSWAPSPASCAWRRRPAPRRHGSWTISPGTWRSPTSGPRARSCTPSCVARVGSSGSPARTPSRPRRRCPTSLGCSTSSAPSPRCSRTTAPCSWHSISRR